MQEQPLCWDLRRWGFNIAIQTRNVSSPRWFSEVPYLLHWRLFGATSGRLEAIGQHGSYNIHLFGFWTKVSWLIIFDWDFHGLQKAFCIHWNHLWTNFVVFFFRPPKKDIHQIYEAYHLRWRWRTHADARVMPGRWDDHVVDGHGVEKPTSSLVDSRLWVLQKWCPSAILWRLGLFKMPLCLSSCFF